MTCATPCPCGRHGIRWTDRQFVAFSGDGAVIVDLDVMPKPCREALQALVDQNPIAPSAPAVDAKPAAPASESKGVK